MNDARRLCAVISLLVIAFLQLSLRGSADDYNGDLSLSFANASRAIKGPGHVRWIGINPLRYPHWAVSVNGKVVAGPSSSQIAGSSYTPVNAVDAGLSSPIPASTAAASDIFLAPYVPGQSAVINDAACKIDVDTSKSDSASESALEDAMNKCFRYVQDNYRKAIVHASDDEEKLAKTTTDYNQLVARADNVIADPTFQSNLVPTDPSPSPDQMEENIHHLRQRVSKLVIGQDTSDANTARALQSEMSAVEQKWPASLAGFAADVAALESALKLHKFATTTKAVAGKPCVGSSAATLDACKQFLSDADSSLAPLQPDKGEATTYVAAASNLAKYVTERVNTLTVQRFYFEDEEICRGVNASRRDVTFTLTLDQNDAISVDVVCESRLMISTGIGFSMLPQRSYANVALNQYQGQTAPPSAPTPLPSGAGIIQAVGVSDVRPIPLTLLNYHVANVGHETEIFTSLGIGVGSSQSSTYVDYVGGLSVGFNRAALVTLGAHLGAQTDLQPGYATGNFSTVTPPVTTRYHPAFVFAITYGTGN